MRNRKVYWIVAATLFAAALVGWAFIPAPLAVEVATVQRGLFEQTVDELARTRIRDHYAVSAPLNGEVERITLREGDDVAAGTAIARLRPALPALLDTRTELELRRRVEAARAAKEAADARLARSGVALVQARREAERSRQLAQSQMVAAAKVESDELALAMANQELESARADAHVAQHEIDISVAALARARDGGRGGGTEWSLTAPIAGRVLRVQQKSGGTVGVGTPLIEFGDPANLEVLIELLTTEAPRVVPGAAVRLSNWGGVAPLSGRVRRVEPWGFTKISALGVEEQRVNVLVDIVSPRKDWASLGEGYRLDAQIQVYRKEQALSVPTGALFRVGERWYVYVVTPERRARQVALSIGQRNDRSVEVLAGVDAGDRVVVYPSDAIRDGVRVAVSNPPSGRP
ncbi:MAG: HlyD family efflux transporter periplasmic adaptor subunit [Steroidobacteraceae bacterium]